ncbi:DUF1178 family protein [Fulvimarina endophytica]|uniref:DUF1178 family protein n=1 Tax=Fulvimarina endophytica TaxID=2293836 RepID=A0A371XAQ2_9HYPH|nr:DUF1178 family protein [Fulvimarina endophytica]RFC66313.1 DUF1178 family protein [Fulvimarina endophytica]
MISYALKCEGGHRFDVWFRSGEDCDAQLQRKLVACAICGTSEVRKALMRPALSSGTARETEPETMAAVPATTPQASSANEGHLGPGAQRLAELWSALHAQAREFRSRSEYVGPRFAEEARKIHYGETEKRSVYGEATPSEVEALSEEGIAALPLPALPEDRN